MKRPVLEVIRFDEADIVTASGLSGIRLAGFGDEEKGNGVFTFFGGSSGVERHGAHDTNIVSAFNQYFDGGWSSTGGIYVLGDFGFISVEGMIDKDSVGSDEPDDQNYSGTYYYTLFEDSYGSSYIFRSN